MSTLSLCVCNKIAIRVLTKTMGFLKVKNAFSIVELFLLSVLNK